MTPDLDLRLGYGTNGFHSHRLDDALAVIAGLGYDGVALTLDHLHLDPFAPDLPRRTAACRRRLDELGLGVVVETGARYVLDPWVKHHPTLVSPSGADRRVDYLHRAIEVAADLGAEAVSFWSGTLEPGADHDIAWNRLTDGVARVLDLADRRGVTLAVEPEPGMFLAATRRRARADGTGWATPSGCASPSTSVTWSATRLATSPTPSRWRAT